MGLKRRGCFGSESVDACKEETAGRLFSSTCNVDRLESNTCSLCLHNFNHFHTCETSKQKLPLKLVKIYRIMTRSYRATNAVNGSTYAIRHTTTPTRHASARLCSST